MKASIKAGTAAAIVLIASAGAGFADDEFQFYNAQIAAVGQRTFEQHLNYTFYGHKQPDFPGGLVPNHALNGTPEFAYGMTDWWGNRFLCTIRRKRQRRLPF